MFLYKWSIAPLCLRIKHFTWLIKWRTSAVAIQFCCSVQFSMICVCVCVCVCVYVCVGEGWSWSGCLSWSLSRAALTRVVKLSNVTTGLLDGCQHAKLKTTSTQRLISVFLPLTEWDCLSPRCWEARVCMYAHGCTHVCVCLCVCSLLPLQSPSVPGVVLSLLPVFLRGGSQTDWPSLIALHKTTWMKNLSVMKLIIMEIKCVMNGWTEAWPAPSAKSRLIQISPNDRTV